MPRQISLAFMAGLLGALVASLALWLAGRYGLTTKLHVAIAPALNVHWLYPRLVIGGLWGLQLLLPIARNAFWRGVSIAVPPILLQLFWIYPMQTGQGWLGLELGTLTPVLIAALWLIWGWTAVLWARASGQ